MKGERLRIAAGFFIISTVWGSTWLAIKVGIESAPPLMNAGLRFLIASVVLYIIARARKLSIPWTPDTRRLYLVMGIVSFSVPFALVYWAEEYIDSGLSSILFAAFPFWVAIFSHFLLKGESLTLFTIGGVLLGIVGVAVIFWGDFRADNPMAALGMGAVVLSTVLQAYTLTVVKRLGQNVSPIVMNFVGMSIGCGVLLAASFLTEPWSASVWNAEALGSMLYLAFFGSVVAFVTYYWLLKRVAPVYLSLTSFINPIVAVLLGAAFRQETLGPSVAFGAALVLGGILVANGRQIYDRIS